MGGDYGENSIIRSRATGLNYDEAVPLLFLLGTSNGTLGLLSLLSCQNLFEE